MRRARSRRRRTQSAVVILALVLVAFGGGSGLAYAYVSGQAKQLESQIASRLESAEGELQAAKTALKDATRDRNPTLVAQAKRDFASAREDFQGASELADGSQLLRRVENLPVVGPAARARHVAVDAIAEMGVHITAAGLDLADLDANLIKPATSGGQQGRTLLTVLGQANTSMAEVRSELDLAQKAAQKVDVRVLSTSQQATFAKARDTIVTALAGIDEFQKLVPTFTEILGGNGARTYLIEQLNPSELRAGGGFIGTYSLLRADHGSLRLIRSGSAYDLADPRPLAGQSGYVTPPGPMRQLILNNLSWSFVDSNYFPDFPSNALQAERFVQPRLGVKIDAVIAMDYYAVAKMLELTGPLAVSGYGVTVSATNFVPLIIQYDLAAYDPAAAPIHKAILSAIAGPLMERISSLSPDRWPALLSDLNELVTNRHLQAYFNDPGVEQQIDQFGWSGTMQLSAAPDFMMEVESNLGGTKANYFVTRQYSITLTRNGNSLHHQIAITLINNMPYRYHPDEYYRAYIRLYVPDTSSGRSDSLTPVKDPSFNPPAGTRQSDGWTTIEGFGTRAQIVFQYDTPWTPDDKGRQEIYWQKQPGTLNDAVSITWDESNGNQFRAVSQLDQDLVISLSSSGVVIKPGRQAQAQLPSLSLG